MQFRIHVEKRKDIEKGDKHQKRQTLKKTNIEKDKH